MANAFVGAVAGVAYPLRWVLPHAVAAGWSADDLSGFAGELVGLGLVLLAFVVGTFLAAIARIRDLGGSVG